jgi:hypothetical protein
MLGLAGIFVVLVIFIIFVVGLVAAFAVAQEQPTSAPAEGERTCPASQPTSAKGGNGEAEMLAVLQKRLPLRYERLMELKRTDPAKYDFHLARMMRWYREWRRMPPALQDADIQQQTMAVRIWRIVDTLRETTSEKARAKLHAALSEAVAQQIEAEDKLTKHHVEMLEKKLARLKEHLEERKRDRAALLRKRVDCLLQAASQPADQDHCEPCDGP